MTKNYLALAIRDLVGSDDFAYSGESYEVLEWVTEPSTIPTSQQVSDKIAELQKIDADLIATKAARKAELLERLGITADEAALLIK
jgi:hypothetical protein